MNFMLLDLDGKKQNCKFDLSTISENDWKFFLEDVVMNLSAGKHVRSISAKVKIRDNQAKVKMNYEDGNYHEVVLTIDPFGVACRNYSDLVSELWQDMARARFSDEYPKELEARINQYSC